MSRPCTSGDSLNKIRFNIGEAELLYSFPKPASDVGTIIRCFTFLNRAAPPTYDEFTHCVSKAMKAGIVRREDGKYAVDRDWYDRIHLADATSGNEIESLIEFESSFVDVDFDEITDVVSVPSADEYRSALATLH